MVQPQPDARRVRFHCQSYDRMAQKSGGLRLPQSILEEIKSKNGKIKENFEVNAVVILIVQIP